MKLKYPLTLGSSSPRRQYLMNAIGFEFHIEKPDVEETFPEEMPAIDVALFLARKKAEALNPTNRVIVTSDTVVVLEDKILNKPEDKNDACRMLTMLAGRSHQVITGVCIKSPQLEQFFQDETIVTFNTLTLEQIQFYVDEFKPLDKAGSYGAQDCLPPGLNPCSEEEIEFLKKINRKDLIKKSFTATSTPVVIINKIEGSYFNVMGLPIHKVYQRLAEGFSI